MIGTNLPRKRSEHGASLILLVSIIGLAFIVTVAAMLVAASYSLNTARLASAKVDVATREDALMREILQQTATGMLSGTDWTAIMTNAANNPNAANNLRATSYVDPNELATLGITGVTTANLGDTGGGNPLDIFKGCTLVPHGADVPWSEVPFGGTSGLANCVPNLAVDYNGNVIDPPLMNWSGNTTLLSANASRTPQEFFLGSQYTGLSATVTKLSPSNRWGQIIYPAIRFGYKQPGNQFIARRVWWRIPVVYQPAQPTVEYQAASVGAPSANSYPSAPANYVLSVYEIPSQLPISGNANLQIGLNNDGTAWGSGIQFTGSIYGGQVQLADPTSSGRTYNSVSSRQQVNVSNPATVGGVPYPDSTDSAFDQPGTREQMALTQTPGVAAPVSVAGNDGKVLLVPVMSGNQFYMSVASPTNWDLYARPYYRCRIRILISGTDSNLIYNSLTGVTNTTTAGAITVKIYCSPDTTTLPDQIMGFSDPTTPTVVWQQNSASWPPLNTPAAPWNSATTTYTGTAPASVVTYLGGTWVAVAPVTGTEPGVTSGQWVQVPPYLTYTSTASTPTIPGQNILVIDVGKMVATLGAGTLVQMAPQLYSIYIGSNPSTEPASPPTSNDPGVAITNTHDLSAFTSGLSLVSNQTLYLLDTFNQVTPKVPTSLYAPQIRYGTSLTNPHINLQGQVTAVATPGPTPLNPLSFSNYNGTSSGLTPTSAALIEITDPTQIPPITALNLLFTIEKERTH